MKSIKNKMIIVVRRCIKCVKLPGVDEHVEEEAPELTLFIGSVDKKTCDRLRRKTDLTSAVVDDDSRRRIANNYHLTDEKRYL